ncbi:DUF6320 domain-containing protein [Anaerosporobacter sp.]|uniref:DUF6320 domain-containing protein n=1 Tax=Anaerosporobacter sp. TaxID=1872529 RepID=UPI00286F64ED|nr:DUF6320 domain-containing protein [Anaerosporobacter sp.]
MRYCKTCGIHYRTPIHSCLFCNNTLEDMKLEATQTGQKEKQLDSKQTNYKEFDAKSDIELYTEHNFSNDMKFFYPAMKLERSRTRSIQKVLYFFLLLGSLCCLGIDLFYTNASDSRLESWSLYVLFSCLFGAIIIHTLSKPSSFLNKVYQIGLCTCLFLVAIALLGRNYHWALDYVLPFGLLALNILATCCIFGSKERMFQYSIYVFGTSMLAFIPLLLYFLSVITTGWPALSCCLYGVLTLFGLFFFSNKEVKEELKRRLHC